MGERLRACSAIALGLIAIALPAAAFAGSGNPVARIAIGEVTGHPGNIVQMPVTLNLLTTPHAAVSGVSSVISFDPRTPIVSDFLGTGPACAVNPAIDKKASTFMFLPSGCIDSGTCTEVAAVVDSQSNHDPIPDGSVLFTCTIEISPNAAPDTYALTNDAPHAIDPDGQELTTIDDSGAVIVNQSPIPCVGDCSGSGEVTIDNLITGVNIDLGVTPVATCPAFDRDGDGEVVINELILAINSALDGCIAETTICERAAAESLNTCVESVNGAERDCYQNTGAACSPDAPDIELAIDTLVEDVRAACPRPEVVQAVGYGPLFTPGGLAGRLAGACRAEPASLAARSFGGPQGAALAAGTTETVACLNQTHEGGTRLLRDQLALYSSCVLDAHANGSCAPTQTDAPAAALQQQLADDIATACGAGTLQTLVAVDESAYAARAAAQARCLTATAHPNSAPLALDCGPRDGLIDMPRGEYVQVVLDSEKYGTRCGDGSPFAFWVRLAPEGAPVENVVVGMQGGGVCIFNDDCKNVDPGLFEAMSDQPPTSGTMSNDPTISPFADWTKVYLPYCNQDVFIGGGTVSNFPDVTVNRFGALNVRAALRYVRDVVWRELDQTTHGGYSPDRMRVLFGGFSAGGFGTLYNYHYVLDDLQWTHTAAYPDASLALDNGQLLGVGSLGAILIYADPPQGWGSRNFVPPYCFAPNCGVGPVLLAATSPRLKSVPEQQFLILSNQVDDVQASTTFFSPPTNWINEMRSSYCETKDLPGVQYYMPAINESVHVISARNELYTNRPVNGVIMRDWLASGFTSPDTVTDEVEEGTLVTDVPGVMPFPCQVAP